MTILPSRTTIRRAKGRNALFQTTSALALIFALPAGPAAATSSLGTPNSFSSGDTSYFDIDLTKDGYHSTRVYGLSSDGSTVVVRYFDEVLDEYVCGTLSEDGTFTAIDNYDIGHLYAISGDGSTLVGYYFYDIATYTSHPFYWTAEDGFVDLGTLGGTSATAVDVSDDGSAIAGHSETGAGVYHSFFWALGDSALTDLGTIGGDRSLTTAISGDGSTVVGYSETAGGLEHAFVWAVGDSAMTDLGTLGGSYSHAEMVSDDGSVVAGYAYLATGDNHAFRWTDAGGMIDLGTLGGTYSYAYAMSDDGDVIAGDSYNASADAHAFRWVVGSDGITGTMTDLGTLGGTYSTARGMDADGSVVVGESTDGDSATHAFRWTEESGMITIEDWLRGTGLTIDDDVAEYALYVSDDGNTIIGRSYSGYDYIAKVGGLITMDTYLPTVGGTMAPRIGQPISSANTIMFGAQGNPMRNLLDEGQKAIWGTVDTGYDDSGASAGGLVLGDFGFGYGIAEGVTARFSAGATYTDQDLSTGGDFQSRGGYVSPEITAHLGSDVYLTVGGYYSKNRLDITRGYLNGAAMDYSSGETTSETWAAKIRLDWVNAFSFGDTTVTPYAALSRTQSRSEAYTETGGAFPVAYGATEDHATIARLGLDFVHPLDNGITLLARAEADYRFEKDSAVTTGTIVGLGTPLSVAGQEVNQFWLHGGIGGEFELGGGTASLMLNVTTEGSDPDVWLRSGWKLKF